MCVRNLYGVRIFTLAKQCLQMTNSVHATKHQVLLTIYTHHWKDTQHQEFLPLN